MEADNNKRKREEECNFDYDIESKHHIAGIFSLKSKSYLFLELIFGILIKID